MNDQTFDFLADACYLSKVNCFKICEIFLTFAPQNTDSKKQSKEGKHRDLVDETSQTFIHIKTEKMKLNSIAHGLL